MFKNYRKKLILICGLVCFSLNGFADSLLVDNYPDRYVVVKGDTLWNISKRFLRQPWRWPEIWKNNPQVKDPHWIYPGDVLEIVFIDGQPRLRRIGSSRTVDEGNGFIRLSPRIRRNQYDEPVTSLPPEIYLHFMGKPYVISKKELKIAPYIVSFSRDKLAATTGDKAFVRQLKNPTGIYEIVRKGDMYKDADTGEILGFEARYLGTARVERGGDPATVKITDTKRELQLYDYLIPAAQGNSLDDFHPKAPDSSITGTIIDLFDGIYNAGKYDVVVIDRGSEDNLQSGDVLDVSLKGRKVIDLRIESINRTITLPNEYSGQVMVFRTFDRVSFALVLESDRSVKVGDLVTSPDLTDLIQ